MTVQAKPSNRWTRDFCALLPFGAATGAGADPARSHCSCRSRVCESDSYVTLSQAAAFAFACSEPSFTSWIERAQFSTRARLHALKKALRNSSNRCRRSSAICALSCDGSDQTKHQVLYTDFVPRAGGFALRCPLRAQKPARIEFFRSDASVRFRQMLLTCFALDIEFVQQR